MATEPILQLQPAAVLSHCRTKAAVGNNSSAISWMWRQTAEQQQQQQLNLYNQTNRTNQQSDYIPRDLIPTLALFNSVSSAGGRESDSFKLMVTSRQLQANKNRIITTSRDFPHKCCLLMRLN